MNCLNNPDYFGEYVSSVSAGLGNQSFFCSNREEHFSRAFFKPDVKGEFEFSLLYQNTTDSTFDNGEHSIKNLILPSWDITSLKVGMCDTVDCECKLSAITIGGKKSYHVGEGATFCTDGFTLDTSKGTYICIEIGYKGGIIPCHPEEVVSVKVFENNEWRDCAMAPLPCMIGAKRKVKKRIAFWGDSITQGIGTSLNSYTHYATQIAKALGEDYAVWDIGLGFARADDAASEGFWAEKAKQNDIVSICFGVNDIYRQFDGKATAENISKIVGFLKKAGCKVLVQTVPVFDYVNEDIRARWEYVNREIKEHIAKECDGYFDCNPILGKKDAPYLSAYGAHPNDEGHILWAKALLPELKKIL